jgi:hypothetical protein
MAEIAGIKSSVAGNSGTRDALLAQGIAVAFALAAWRAEWAFARDPQSGFVISLACFTAAGVVSLWSVLISLRLLRRGQAWKIPAAIIGLVVFELSILSVLSWNDLITRYALSHGPYIELYFVAAPVLFPVLTATILTGTIAAVVLRGETRPRLSRWRKGVLCFCGFLFAVFCLTVVPGALFLFSVIMLQSEYTTRSWEQFVVRATPGCISGTVDRVCATAKDLDRFHSILVTEDYLQEARLIENLNDPSDKLKEVSLDYLTRRNPDAVFRIAMDAAKGKFPADPLIRRSLGCFLGRNGSDAQIEWVLDHAESVPGTFMDGFIISVQFSNEPSFFDRENLLPALSRAVLSGRLTRPKALTVFADAYFREMDRLGIRRSEPRDEKRWLYMDWAWYAQRLDFSAEQWGEKLCCLQDILAKAGSSDLSVRRTIAIILADISRAPLEHTPRDYPFEDSKQQIAETTAEREELQKIALQAKRSVPTPALLLILSEPCVEKQWVWKWLKMSDPAAALRFAEQGSSTKEDPAFEAELGAYVAAHSTDEKIKALLNGPYGLSLWYEALLRGLGRFQRTAFLPDLWQFTLQSAELTDAALDSACSMDTDEGVLRGISDLIGRSRADRALNAIRFCRTTDLRAKIALQLLDVPTFNGGGDWGEWLQEKTLESALENIPSGDFHDMALKKRWTERLSRFQHDETGDKKARRERVYAAAQKWLESNKTADDSVTRGTERKE